MFFVTWLAWNGEENITCISDRMEKDEARNLFNSIGVDRDIPCVSLWEEGDLNKQIAYKHIKLERHD